MWREEKIKVKLKCWQCATFYYHLVSTLRKSIYERSICNCVMAQTHWQKILCDFEAIHEFSSPRNSRRKIDDAGNPWKVCNFMRTLLLASPPGTFFLCLHSFVIYLVAQQKEFLSSLLMVFEKRIFHISYYSLPK